MQKKCLICSEIFVKKVKDSQKEWSKKKYCSYQCYWKSKIGHSPWNKGIKAPKISLALKGRKLTDEWKNKIRISNTGKKRSLESIKKSSMKTRRENAYQWKGDDVGYNALHIWVRKEFGQPKKCEHCQKDNLTGKSIHWANKTGLYKRDISDWLRLCVSCHRLYDYKFKIKMK